jgi:hypothetical protein
VIDRLILRMGSRVGVEVKPWCSRFWMAIMPSTREGNGWKTGLTRASLHDDRLGPILDALFAAHRNRVFGAIALKALAVYALPTPWLPQETTTMALYGVYEDEPKALGAPRPAYGHSKDGRDGSVHMTQDICGKKVLPTSPSVWTYKATKAEVPNPANVSCYLWTSSGACADARRAVGL